MPSPRQPEPAGFGNCGVCAYAEGGPLSVCFRCARATIEPLARRRCMVCDQATGPDGRCGNPLCNRSLEVRGWNYIYAIAMKTGQLDRAIKAYKYEGKWGWGWIFGRVAVGYLRASEDVFREFDMIIPSPTYVGTDGRSRDHTGEVLQRATSRTRVGRSASTSSAKRTRPTGWRVSARSAPEPTSLRRRSHPRSRSSSHGLSQESQCLSTTTFSQTA
jgi:predicted amidophosphoribosyltransferase